MSAFPRINHLLVVDLSYWLRSLQHEAPEIVNIISTCLFGPTVERSINTDQDKLANFSMSIIFTRDYTKIYNHHLPPSFYFHILS